VRSDFPTGAVEHHSWPRRPVVLLVVADEDERAVHAYGLSALGFDLVVADSAREAQARALAMRPDVVVTDRPQLETDRWTVVRALKSDPRTRGIPVIVLTDSTATLVRERAEREGCDALCLRPCEPGTLALVLRAVLDRRPTFRLRHAHAAR